MKIAFALMLLNGCAAATYAPRVLASTSAAAYPADARVIVVSGDAVISPLKGLLDGGTELCGTSTLPT